MKTLLTCRQVRATSLGQLIMKKCGRKYIKSLTAAYNADEDPEFILSAYKDADLRIAQIFSWSNTAQGCAFWAGIFKRTKGKK